MPVRVQTVPIDIGREIEALHRRQSSVGAIASFIGTVREVNAVDGASQSVSSLTLEHYPGMTEKALAEICAEAAGRFEVIDTLVVHRVGELLPADPIVLVVVLSAHRAEAFAACEFIMDYLKTRAPFWKKEQTPAGPRWVDARSGDDARARRWRQP
jgi:molybdopterin synthase catalytic subunit